MHNCAFITGASSGIGSALARLLGAKKIRLILTGRNEKSLLQTADDARMLGASSVEVFPADLGNAAGVDMACDVIKKEVPDLVINCAGLGLYGDAIEIDPIDQQHLIDVNVSALFRLSVAAARALVEQDKEGVIMNLSSAASVPPFPGFAAYSASKAFVNQLSISMDYELSERGVRVLVTCPGVIASQFRERAGGHPITAEVPGVMTPEYAAEQIWMQIQKKKQIRFFSFRYRLLNWLTRYILPKGLVAGMLRQKMKSIHDE